ncbi:phosphatidylethanolamine--Kdo2-lipid A phosphoethanolamine transferase [Sulfitobacter alexandrii]|uniref:Phosphatidylethanolamine--Kdo2-lipid A phosphoethanolamine transferase n=1 Tax=Sulfitobacter alexandrii TaxID=1917485 RepID=A0A1J0WM46_9RHOB|nr:phosphatidylethanolamine--Kdo2-lipid A phosphoethanolamine transferase [Sulfitobacter alexandrii]
MTLSLLTALFIFAVHNATFWRLGSEIFAGHPLSFAGFIAAVFCLALAVLSVFSFPYTVKPFLTFVLILGSVTSYYMDRLGVIVDRDMIQNVMVTTVTESKHLVTFSFVAQVLLTGVLPAVVVWLVRIKPQRRLKTLLFPVVSLFLLLGLTAGFLLADLKSYAAVFRERKDLMSSFQPFAPMVGAIRYVRMVSATAHVEAEPIEADAHRGASYEGRRKPMLTIVVAGETARAQNFGLNGYERDTTPMLAERRVMNFSNVASCGTATAVSLPCMFSKFTRSGYSYENGVAHQNVLDVLDHAGLHVEWWDNNTGDKGLAKRLDSRSLTHADNPEFCAAGECMDGILIDELRSYVKDLKQDTVLVLHQIGSHGPTYYLRYPPEFERFAPACRTAEFKECTSEEIVNAYDNTIAYTDSVLAAMIDLLAAQKTLDTALVYVSDHGESLGESGLYLHGSPYFMAPDVQTTVPMVLWLSEGFKATFGLDATCLAKKADDQLSHDNLFHSLLGMLDISTEVHDPALDIFASCRSNQKVAQK